MYPVNDWYSSSLKPTLQLHAIANTVIKLIFEIYPTPQAGRCCWEGGRRGYSRI
uniref:Uncharacterized protein n=1 Tax=Rhizophora mucronata TaxID=61149 RepID=A0A2P2P951_RHIMU